MDFVYFLFVASLTMILMGFMAMVVTRLFVSFILVVVNFSIFFMIFIADLVNAGPTSYLYLLSVNYFYMGFRPEDLVSGDPFKMVTWIWHMFAHGSWKHLMFNTAGLAIWGFWLEMKVKRRGILIAFFAGGLGGALMNLAMAYLAPDVFHYYPNTVSVGASGGIFGLLGICIVLYPNIRTLLLGLPMWSFIFMYFLLESLMMFYPLWPGVGHGAHVGGFIAGMMVTPIVRRFAETKEEAVKEISEGTLEELKAMAEEEGHEDLYRKIEEEDIPEVRQAWVEELVKKSRCPRCGRGLRVRGSAAICNCGWRLRI